METEGPRRAIVIGASSGIGRALVGVLVREGYRVGATARRAELLRELEAEHAGAVIVSAFDVADVERSVAEIERLAEALGGVDLAVISAGVGHPSTELSWPETDETIAVNVRGWTAAAFAFMRLFEANGTGHLVNLSSLAALRGIAGATAYNASKAFASNAMQGLRQRAVSRGLRITVTDVQLGLVRTAMAKVDRIPSWVVGPEVAAEHVWRDPSPPASRVCDARVALPRLGDEARPGFVWDRLRT
ncbi:MAG: SDR family NAD(P)-dependent oxidoreductase [Planctomycetota bacterium]